MKKPSTFTIDTQFILTSSSVATRYLPSEPVSSIKRLNRPNFWRSQTQFYQHRGYICTIRQTHQSPLLNILGVQIYLGPAGFDNDCEDIVTVFIEISDEGTRHPQVFARHAPRSDVASRLAFIVLVQKKSDGSRRALYPFSTKNIERNTFRINSLADQLLYGSTWQEIATRPRRFVVTQNKALKISLFNVTADGGYTTPFLNEASTGNTGTTRRCSSYANEEHPAEVIGELESSDSI
jgi:hypothetical protein